MGCLEKWRERAGDNSARVNVVIVPGVCAKTLGEQTCSHFEKWIETCCTAPNSPVTVWIYHHGVEVVSRQCWDAFCSAGEALLKELLSLCQSEPQPEDANLVLVGHRLGAFILKKALVDAHQNNHHAQERAVFEALQTLVMIGDPYLHNDNRSEWTQQVNECLQSPHRLSAEVCGEQALSCLKSIFDRFEDITLHSRFFQVSGRAPVNKPRLLRLKSHPKYKGCVCYAYISVRMWTTADDDDTVPEGEGDDKSCVFHSRSRHHKSLLLIASNEYIPERSLMHKERQTTMPGSIQDTRSHPFADEFPADTTIVVPKTTNPSTPSGNPMNSRSASSDSDVDLPSNSNISQTSTTHTYVNYGVISVHEPLECEGDCPANSDRADFLVSVARPSTAADAECTNASGACAAPDCFVVAEQNASACRAPRERITINTEIKDQDSFSNRADASYTKGKRNGKEHIESEKDIRRKEEEYDGHSDLFDHYIGNDEGDECETKWNESKNRIRDNDAVKYVEVPNHRNTKTAVENQDSGSSEKPKNSPSRFASDRDFNYKLSNSCPSMRETDGIKTSTRSRRLPLRLGLPQRPSHFFGRRDILETLKSTILAPMSNPEEGDIVKPGKNLVILQGIGGIGKTATALEFVHGYGEHFGHIFWVQASNRLTLAQSFHEMAVAVGLIRGHNSRTHAQSRATLRAWFETTASKWLLIFDEADDLRLLKPYLIPSNRGWVIVTTRKDDSTQHQQLNGYTFTIQVPPLTDSESLQFLLNTTSLPIDVYGSRDSKEVGKLLGGHPLALSIAAAHVNGCSGSLSERVASWHNLGRVLQNATSPADLSRKIHLGRNCLPILSTMLDLGNMSPKATDLCTVLAYLDPYDIQDSISLAAQSCKRIPLREFPATDEQFAEAKDECLASHLCDHGTRNRSVRMNRAIQWAVQASMGKQKAVDAFDTASILLLSQWPSKRKLKNIVYGNWPEFNKLHSHVHGLSEYFMEISREDPSRQCYSDRAFPTLLLQSTWYNSYVLGNVEEDLPLIELAHSLLASSRQENSESTSQANIEFNMPRRLVSIEHDTRSWKVIETNGQHLDFCALSYVWGDQDPDGTARLTKSTLRRCQTPRCVSEMPQLYHDACEIAKRLGVSYLWCDSLCIVQDDAADKASEIAKMADIYRCATWTICIDSQRILPVSSEENLDRRLKSKSYSILSRRPSLSSRAWVFQESLTSLNVNKYVPELDPGLDRSTNTTLSPRSGSLDLSELIFRVDLSLEQMNELIRSCSVGSSKESHNEATPTSPSEVAPDANVGQEVSREDELVDSQTQHCHVLNPSLELATNIANEGINHYDHGEHLKAIGKFLKARDYMSAFMAPSIDAIHGHLLFTTYLALAYLGQQCAEEAMDILMEAKRLLEKHIVPDSQMPLIIVGRFYLALGDVHHVLNHMEEARHSYDEAAKRLTDEEGAGADLSAIVQLKISNIYVSNGLFKEAHELIGNTIAHFEAQDTSRGQAQYARALYRQALAFGAEKKERIRKVKLAAAKQALLDFREEQGFTDVLTDSELSKEKFEDVLEFGFK